MVKREVVSMGLIEDVLEEKIKEGNYKVYNSFYGGYEVLKQERIKSLSNVEPMVEYDDFGRHVLVTFYRKVPKETEVKIDKEEINSTVEMGDILLYAMYEDGQDQSFMHDDGSIEQAFILEEDEENERLNLYVFYRYVGK